LLTLPVFLFLQVAYYRSADSLLQLLVMPSMVAIVKMVVLVDLQTKCPNDLTVGLYYTTVPNSTFLFPEFLTFRYEIQS